MNRDKQINDPLKDFMKGQQPIELPSSFRIEMMEKVRKEGVRRRKRMRWLSIATLVGSIIVLLTVGVLAWIYMDIPALTVEFPSIGSMHIYIFMAVIVATLLAGDHWMRKVYAKKKEKKS